MAAVLTAGAIAIAMATPAPAVPRGPTTVASADARASQDAQDAQDTPFTRKLTADLLAHMQRLRVPGAIVSVSTPAQGTWTTALGTADLATGTPISARDHMRVGSITKTFTGTVILQLVQEGRLALDKPVAAYRQGVPNGGRITIRQLLQMTSGLYNYAEDPRFNRQLDQHPERYWSPQELLDIAFRHPVYFPPGTGYHYSNTNYVLLGLIAEQVTGRPLARLLRERVFEPAGLEETSFANGRSIPRPHAQGYMFIDNVDSLTAPVLTGKDAAWADWSAGNPRNATRDNASLAWSAGAAVSTVDDLRRWAKTLATGTLLSPAVQRDRLTFVPTSDLPGAPTYGLAVANILGYIGHDGEIPGYNSFMGYDPATRTTIVVLTNLNQSPDGTAPAIELTKQIIDRLTPQDSAALS
ncbi:serine hydrolase domain-containing protein [Streptomyces rubiginosohelvolus]|uniref:serine hydrolase domain-containing protein n=1 Tax=Streptomyces rubiginosohelvolus TaxID=67362 RepID=UPI0036A8DA8E